MTILAWALIAQLVRPGATGVQHLSFDYPEAGTVRYGIFVPKSYDSARQRPLVLALHPGSSTGPYYGSSFMESIVMPGLVALDPIIIAPDCPTRSWTDPVSEHAVMALVQKTIEQYAIDRRRILVIGYSLGGRGTWFFSSQHPDVFTAAIPMAASPRDEPIDRLGTMPTYIIHSRQDQVSPFAPAEQNAQALKEMGRPITFEALSGPTHFEMGAYITPIRRAVKWITEQWDASH